MTQDKKQVKRTKTKSDILDKGLRPNRGDTSRIIRKLGRLGWPKRKPKDK